MNVRVSFDMDEPQAAELERIARRENITLGALMARLADQRLEYEAWFKTEVQKGLDSVARGELIDDDDVFRGIEARMAARDTLAG